MQSLHYIVQIEVVERLATLRNGIFNYGNLEYKYINSRHSKLILGITQAIQQPLHGP